MKVWKKILLALLVVGIAGGSYGYYLWHKKPADVRTLQADIVITATALLNDYNKDEAQANKKYLDKTIAVTGTILQITIEKESGQSTVALDAGDLMAAVSCSFYNEELESVKKLTKGLSVTIKGKCTGKLMDVVLNKCSVNK